ncbi:MAG: hypothetical protein ACQSGP_06830 [Frankia sp.]
MRPPSVGKAAYYLGLGGLAVAEVIEWPIAVAIAAGTYVAQHTGPRAATPREQPAQEHTTG